MFFHRVHHSAHQPTRKVSQPRRGCWRTQFLLATAVFTGVNALPMATTVLAASPTAGTVIENQATGSFLNPADGSTVPVESNIVQVTVLEIAGVTVTPIGVLEAPSTISNAGPSQNDGSINAEDVVYFTFQVTNVGNDPTQFFLPGAPSSITGGTQAGQIEIIAVDLDGPSGEVEPTDYSAIPVTIRPEGNSTAHATVLGLPQGAIPANGTLTLRVPVKLDAGLNPGDTVAVVLGDTGANDNSAGTQNQVYSASAQLNPPDGGFDLYTQDNADNDGIADEANGDPFNGDSTFHRQEASALNSTMITDPSLTLDYGDAPDTGAGVGPGNYQTQASDAGAAHTIVPNLYIGTVPDGDDGTQQNATADMDDTAIAADEGEIGLSAIANNATTYTISNIAVTNNTANTANLVAWIDFNQNGVFEAAEAATVSVPNTGEQTVSLTWSSLPGLTGGQTYARFRLTTDTSIATGVANTSIATGTALDGEVEDYAVTVSAAFNISGTLYEDLDGNNSYASGSETTLPANITVRLLSSDGTTEVATTLTDANGFYQFTNVVPGNYQVVVETSDPDIPFFLSLGTPNDLAVTISNNSFAGLDFGFDRRTLSNGGLQPACRNPYGEVYSVTGPNIISAVHGETGSVYDLTTSTFGDVTAINGAATDHVNRLVYYGNGNSLYAWDAINNQHFAITTNFQQELTNVGYTGAFANLSSGGAAFYNGSMYIGVDGGRADLFPGITQNFEIFKVDFTLDGRTITNITPLNVVAVSSSSANPLDQDSEDWGDFIISDDGILLAISTNRDTGRRHLWQFDLNSNTYTDVGVRSDNFQLAKDGEGRLWGLATIVSGFSIIGSTIQEIDLNGNFTGPANDTMPHVSFDAAECVRGRSTIGDRIWNDFNDDGIQDFGEPGIANVTVGLYRDIGNNGLDAGDPLLATQVTNANGNYDFTDLVYGNYIVRVLEGTPDDQDSTNVLADATLTTTTTTPNGIYRVTLPTGIVDHNDGDFGYNVGQPQILLVKRITAINGQNTNPNDGTDLSSYVNGSGSADEHPNWPSTNGTNPDLFGATTGGIVKPGDEVEYTIYFLSAGQEPANNVMFCDRVPDGQTFVLNAFANGTPSPDGVIGEERGIEIAANGNTLAYTNIGGDDMARFYPPTSGLPPTCNLQIPNTEDNGAVVVELGTLPGSVGPGMPTDAFGYVRFRAIVK